MELPARIGKYELEEFLGGGMSHVFRARDTVIGRTVAVKVLTDAGCQDSDTKARFLAEARMAGNLVHDNILSIYDFGADEQGRPFMVMEFLRGEDLRNAIKKGHTGDLKAKLKIAVQAARALQYIHTQKIVHRDIKPENIHINTAGVVKLMDFGIAKTEGLSMTRAGYVLGTPYYMAPEQVTGMGITEQVDVYAFGVMLFEIVTGAKPISGETVERIFYSILNEPLNLEPLRQTGVPQSVIDLVGKCTLKNPAERPQGFAPVCAELDRMIAELDAPTLVLKQEKTLVAPAASTTVAPSASTTVAPAEKKRPAWVIPAIVLGVLVLGAGGYFATRTKPDTPPPPPATGGKEPAKTISTSTGDMVLVPAGPFLFGEKKESVDLPAFYVDKTEVTNAAYQAFCKATNRPLPEDFPEELPTYPVVNVSILDAQNFATWAGKRLPNAKEWEKAARGTDGRLYPWGSDPDPKKANVAADKDHPGSIRPADGLPEGASPSGALQMAGNVWELVFEVSPAGPQALEYFAQHMNPKPTPEELWYSMRGQSYSEPLQDGVLWDKATVPRRWKRGNIGFRCVKDAK